MGTGNGDDMRHSGRLKPVAELIRESALFTEDHGLEYGRAGALRLGEESLPDPLAPVLDGPEYAGPPLEKRNVIASPHAYRRVDSVLREVGGIIKAPGIEEAPRFTHLPVYPDEVAVSKRG